MRGLNFARPGEKLTLLCLGAQEICRSILRQQDNSHDRLTRSAKGVTDRSALIHGARSESMIERPKYGV